MTPLTPDLNPNHTCRCTLPSPGDVSSRSFYEPGYVTTDVVGDYGGNLEDKTYYCGGGR